ncbi:hypothetical protein [Clostridium acidisoli]|uniref:hypothetical protein n=1 Tax=Clostridium acidisoli TaxID=91624 RepID=UPI001592CE42|nr:hypothetical protein [Clostridium acidisoli]
MINYSFSNNLQRLNMPAIITDAMNLKIAGIIIKSLRSLVRFSEKGIKNKIIKEVIK